MNFRIATFNILASAYISPERYPNVDRRWLDPFWRTPAILDLLERLDVQLLCLQEVEPDVFDALNVRFPSWTCRYEQKSSSRPEGCAILARNDACQVIDVSRIDYIDGALGRVNNSGSIAQLVVIEADLGRFLVANTHVRWDPPMTPIDAKIGCRQTRQFLDACRNHGQTVPNQLICGDFNSEPEGDVVAMMTGEGFSFAHADTGARSCVTGGRAKLIDYIFHTKSLEVQPHEPPKLADKSLLPSTDIPSDHVPLVAAIRAKSLPRA